MNLSCRTQKFLLDAGVEALEEFHSMSIAASEPKSDRLPLYKRPWVAMSGIVLLLVGIVVYLHFFRDDPPPQDADLIPAFLRVESAKDPFADFAQELASRKLDDWANLPEEAKAWGEGQEAVLQGYLDRHTAERSLFNELMNTDPALWRWRGVNEWINAKTEFSDMAHCMVVVGQLGKTEVILLERAGRHSEAMEKALQLARFGNRLKQMDGALIHRLIAVTAQRVGEDLLKTALISTADAGRLRQVQDALSDFHDSPSSLSMMLKVEYLFSKNSPVKPEEATMNFWGVKDWERVSISYMTLPNRTAAEYCDRTRRLVQASNQDWMAVTRVCQEITGEDTGRFSEGWRLYTKPNLGGKIILSHDWSSARMVILKACAGEALHRMTIATLALRRYELAHGRLPDTLQELVPLPD